jgi:tetratricopeptide (TPR) repeat protein
VQIGMADALRGLGRRKEALRWLQDHPTEHPEDAYAQKMIGHVLYELGRYAQANEIFPRFPVDDDDTDLRLARARVAIMLGRFADARAEFHRLREAFRQRTRADDWLVATETLERSGVERPAVTDADLFAQISAMIDLAMIEEARRLMTAAESSERNSAMLAALRGHLAFATRDWRAARDAYNRAVALGMEPDRIRARLDEAESRYQYQRKRSREEEAAVTGRVGVS